MEKFNAYLILEKEIPEDKIIDCLNKYTNINSINYKNNEYNVKNVEVVEKMNKYILVIDLEA